MLYELTDEQVADIKHTIAPNHAGQALLKAFESPVSWDSQIPNHPELIHAYGIGRAHGENGFEYGVDDM